MSAHAHEHAGTAPIEVLDPVCGMTISPDDAVGHVDYTGRPYPWFGVLLSPMIASAAMTFSSVLVIGNA